ncbi:hypothetical protein [Mesorhizobium sp.]|nr:hypothetical protein [Mesorhizobium sp.]RWP48772.1 MAG: hypothetical protein EOR06_26605 [Mesorhizobium sp.]
MADPYFRDFWIVTLSGEQLFPKKIRDRDTGELRYQFLGEGSNKKSDGSSTPDPAEAARRFLAGESLRFGNESAAANRFKINGGFIQSFGASADF